MKNISNQSDYVPVRLEKEIHKKLQSIAIAKGTTKSNIIRNYIYKGLKDDGYTENDEKLKNMLKSSLNEILHPQVERLASISAKATHIAAAAFFMELFAARLSATPEHRDLIDEAAGRARKLGIEYLKLKDDDIDNFLQSSFKNFNKKEEI